MANLSDIEATEKIFSKDFPADAPYNPFPGSSVGAWLDHGGNTPASIAAGLVKGMKVLGFPADPSGQFQGARGQAFNGHFNLQDTIEPYYMEGKGFPADQYIINRITSEGASVNYDGSPAVPASASGAPVGAQAKLDAIRKILAS